MSYPIRRVQIVGKGKIGTGYFKPGQFAYVIGEDDRGGNYWIDQEGQSAPGQTAYLISKTKDMRGGALWISPVSIRFTARKK